MPMKKLIQPFIDIVFPHTCACCGQGLGDQERYICRWCRVSRFDEAIADDKVILPNNVMFVFSMWQFDKGGYLQDLLHGLKYNFLQEVGEELGYFAGRDFLDKADPDLLQSVEAKSPLLIPVPLHKSKKRTRGYNQSRALARGFSRATGWEVIQDGIIKRVKKTKTQTGLNTKERNENLRQAFVIDHQFISDNYFPIVIDDVFTTGATTFELVNVVANDGSKAGIVTIAKS